MNCREARAGLPHYLNDELSASERELLQAHLAECEACFAELQSLNTMQRQIRTGLHVATDRVEPSSQAWAKLHTALQSKHTPQPAPQLRSAFFLQAMGAVFAMLSVMVGVAVLRPGVMGNLAPTSEAPVPVPTQLTLQQPARTPTTAIDSDHKLLAALLKTEPNQSVQTAISILSDADLHGLYKFSCRACLGMQ